MPILCKYNLRWYLCHRGDDESQACSLSCGVMMPHEEGFTSVNNYLAKQLADNDGIEFFPDIRFSGCKIVPECWGAQSREPDLICIMMGNQFTVGDDVVAAEARRSAILNAGWVQTDSSVYRGLVNVRDLEMIQGSLPSGAF